MWAGHGLIDLPRALAVSCNPYFEWVGEQLGYETIQRYAHLLGLGEPSGINLTGEAAGRVPLFVRLNAVGHLSSHAAGIETSAVQLAVLVSATVNGGVVLKPQVSGEQGFVPTERWRLPETTRLDGLASGFAGAVNEGSASADVLAPRLVRVLRPGGEPGAGGRRLPEARERPRRLRRGRPHLPRALRQRLRHHGRRHAVAGQHRHSVAARRAGARIPASSRQTDGRSSSIVSSVASPGTTSTSRSSVRKPGRTISIRCRPGASFSDEASRADPRKAPST
jgi:hypothetical protein